MRMNIELQLALIAEKSRRIKESDDPESKFSEWLIVDQDLMCSSLELSIKMVLIAIIEDVIRHGEIFYTEEEYAIFTKLSVAQVTEAFEFLLKKDVIEMSIESDGCVVYDLNYDMYLVLLADYANLN